MILLWFLSMFAVFNAQVVFEAARRLYRSVSQSCACFNRVSQIYPPYRHDA